MTQRTGIPHTCVDRPHLPCDACGVTQILPQVARELMTDYNKELDEMHTEHLAKMVTLAFRFGYRACLVDCVPRPEIVPDAKINARARLFLDSYYRELGR